MSAPRRRTALFAASVLLTALVGAHGVAAAPAPAAAAVSTDPQTGPHALDARRHPSAVLSAAAPPKAAAPRPLVQRAAAARLSQEVFGYAPYWDIAQWSEWRMQDLSTIAYFSVTINADGSVNAVSSDPSWVAWQSADLSNMVNAAHAAGTRVLVTIKQFDEASIDSIVENATYRQNAINSAISLMNARGLDGVTVDFEGFATSTYPNIAPAMTSFIAQLTQQVHAAKPGSETVLATYGSSADNDSGLFNIDALRGNVDAFYIMAYDMFQSGIASAQSPLRNANYNDTSIVQRYLTRAPAGEIILGVPYYGYKWNTGASNGLNAHTTGGFAADTYSGAMSDFACAQSLSLNWDAGTVTPWAAWYSPATGDPCGGDWGSWRELYYDDVNSLGAKYDLVRSAGLRGTGPWALGYDTGRGELWDLITSKFSSSIPQATMQALSPNSATRDVSLNWSLNNGSSPATTYTVWINDTGAGWIPWSTTGGAVTSAAFTGAAGHTYGFWVQAANSVGSSVPPSGSGQTQTTIAVNAAPVAPFAGMYSVDAYGNVHPDHSAPLYASAVWGSPLARAAALIPGQTAGYVADAWGGLHPFGGAAAVSASAYWPGWDIVRGVVLASASSGYTLDGWGGVHPFGGAATVTTSAYFQGWDIARGLVLRDATSGWVLDGWGGLHGFGTPGHIPPDIRGGPYWQGWDIARGVVLDASHPNSGYVLDGWGGVHPFGGAVPVSPAPTYWSGWNIARAIVLLPGQASSGYTLDGYGGVHPFGAAPPVTVPGYLGYDATRALIVG